MLSGLTKLFDLNHREVNRFTQIISKVGNFNKEIDKLKDHDFASKTAVFRDQIKSGKLPNDILPEAFALAREASSRAVGLRHYDVQLIAAAALFEGRVGEQKTGEGKTLSAVPALYLHALSGGGVHLVTVNDYLARRDAGWMAPIFNLLGISVGVIIQENKSFIYDPEFSDKSHGDDRLSHLKPISRKEAYAADVVYGTNNEFGFDYLRDNMAGSINETVQRGHNFAIVDEVDSVLIDEARTPLIISAPDAEPTNKYYEYAQLVDKLSGDTDFQIDEKTKSAHLTEHGIVKVEKILGVANLYEKDFETIHHLENALRARTLYLKDKDYVVRDNEVIIVDEFTGRLMVGRRWSDGLHQAVEAKENVQIQQESRTLATISFQNYFRLYSKLSGMTGTAATEAEEFHKIYGLDVLVIPTHRQMVRRDHSDIIYKTIRAKYGAVVEEIETLHKKGQPVLVGTTSIEKNEIISEYLKRRKIPHEVLNAKQHEREAGIITEAGKRGAVTVATNMAGRGVDIVLGGTMPSSHDGASNEFKKWKKEHDEILELGGLHVIGTERHEARRIDNQLRGRAGRQGDPGSSRFYLSLEDDLMRIFGGERISSLMTTLNIGEDQPIENRLVTRAIEQAQVKVEGFHFDTRKRLVEYDDVANRQRTIIYEIRKEILEGKDVSEEVKEKLKSQVGNVIDIGIVGENVDHEGIIVNFLEIVPFDDESKKKLLSEVKKLNSKLAIEGFLTGVVDDVYKTREQQVGAEMMRQVERYSYLTSIDRLWVEHLDSLEDLREGTGLRGGNEQERIALYKSEAFGMFERLIAQIDSEIVRRLFRIQINAPVGAPTPVVARPERITTNVDTADNTGLKQSIDNSPSAISKKIGRNDPCWCMSGKKWKKCHYPQTG